MKAIATEINCNGTPVIVGSDALNVFIEKASAYKRIIFLVDFRTLRKCLAVIEELLPEKVECSTLVIQEGERFKNLNTCTLLWKQMQELKVSRRDLFVNVGGGVVCDLGAFVASVFKRGMDFMHVPTSLMAMCDAAIGGKAGVDLEHIKNQIGLFTHPHSVYIYPPFLETLDKRHFMNGMAEILKYALIADVELWEELKEDQVVFSDELLIRSVQLKTDIINDDFKEQGRRKLLNFGHTAGHAIETFSMIHDSRPLLHGEAIAAGMICEAFLSIDKLNLSAAVADEIREYILRRYGKYNFPKEAIPELISIMEHDKKNENRKISFSLISEPGRGVADIYCSADEISKALNNYRKA